MFSFADTSRLRNVLALGAHSDDIEIGCGGTLLRLIRDHGPELNVRWVVFGGADERRAEEARASAARFLDGCGRSDVVVHGFRDAYFNFDPGVKDAFEATKRAFQPDVVFTHFRDDRHQDHRVLSDLAWNTWRSHLILEYEIPKYDGDLGRPNVYAPLPEDLCRRKIDLLMQGFPTQAGKQWFTEDTFQGLMRLRGIEAGPPHRFAEAFHGRKIVL